ncbi:putative leader peptide [Streptomyces sp. NPDC090306]
MRQHHAGQRASSSVAMVFSRLSRRRHIDLKRSTSCLCHA